MRISYTATGGDAAMRALGMLGQKAENMRPVFAQIGSDVVADAQMRFKSSQDPYGQAWAPLAASTLRQRRGGGKGAKPLLDTGALRNSLTMAAGNDGVVIGSNVKYAAIHQFGGTISREARSVVVRLRKLKGGRVQFAKKAHKRVTEVQAEVGAHTITIPARPYVAQQSRGLPREYGEFIRDALMAHFSVGQAR